MVLLIEDLRNKHDEITSKYKEQKKKGFPSKAESGNVLSNNHPNNPNNESVANSQTVLDIQARCNITSQSSTKNGKKQSKVLSKYTICRSQNWKWKWN